MITHTTPKAHVASNKNVCNFRHHFLALLFHTLSLGEIWFFCVSRYSWKSPTATQVLFRCFFNTQNKMNHTLSKGMKNCVRKLFRNRLCLGLLLPFEKYVLWGSPSEKGLLASRYSGLFKIFVCTSILNFGAKFQK